jgi:hypothetical protein
MVSKYQNEGNYLPKKRGGSAKKIDLEGLKKYLKANEGMTLKKSAKTFLQLVTG